jgi:signal transduction histidine kinase
VQLPAEHRRALEALALRRLPVAMAVFLAFLGGALPIELFFYPGRLRPYLLVYGLEIAVSGAAYAAALAWAHRTRTIATAWASALGLCICTYYPVVGGDATLAAAALICLVAAMPTILPFGTRHQLVLGGVCAAGFFAIIASGVRSSLPWPYIFIAFTAVTVATSIGAHGQARARREAAEREGRLAQAHEQLRMALGRAETAVAMRSRLVANVSHELRTPINVIVGYADMLMDAGMTGSDVADTAARIRHNAETLEALIGELLDLSRLSSGKVAVAIEDVDVPSLLADVAERTRFGLGGKPVSVDVDCTLARCPSDRLRLGQILTNLASNAAKFTAGGRITIGARATPEGHVFAVRDTGCGIPADRQESIFDAFEQVVPGLNGAGGIGLGLAIVRQLVDLLGGTVHVASEVGVGSTFTVVLPAVPAPACAPVPDAAAPAIGVAAV